MVWVSDVHAVYENSYNIIVEFFERAVLARPPARISRKYAFLSEMLTDLRMHTRALILSGRKAYIYARDSPYAEDSFTGSR